VSTRLRFLGVAGFEIVGPRWRVLIDPFLTGQPGAPVGPDELQRPDVILVTHAAPDHLGDTAAIARRTGAPVVCGADVGAFLAAVPARDSTGQRAALALEPGATLRFDGADPPGWALE
jgi:L-ascorbate metabolism protein UlaG (beta-lactamase superfamily)